MPSPLIPTLPRSTWAAIAAAMLLGLALRIGAATGGLWVDEAWSASFAAQTGSPLGVFLFINHDNNHHLNTLWLQLVGLSAPPAVARGLAILTGTASILVAAIIGARRSRSEAWIAALLFAVAEAMVTFGSEARGYGPMMLAALVAILLVDRWLDDPAQPPPARGLGWCFLLGMLAHLTMVFVLAALGGWLFLALLRREGPVRAAMSALRLLWPGLLAVIAVALLVAGAAWASPGGFTIGSLTPFTFASFQVGMSQIVSSTLGPALTPLWLLPAFAALLLITLVAVRPHWLGTRAPFYLLAILGLPAAMAVLQPPNAVMMRYYLLSCLALLLLAAQLFAAGVAAGGWPRRLALVLLAAVICGGLMRDAWLIANQRGDPDGPVRILAGAAPAGAEVAIANPRARAILDVAAAEHHYPLRLRDGACAPAPYLFVDRDPGKPNPATLDICGRHLVAIGSAATNGLSGGDWTLYEQRRLPSAAPPVSDPPPAPK